MGVGDLLLMPDVVSIGTFNSHIASCLGGCHPSSSLGRRGSKHEGKTCGCMREQLCGEKGSHCSQGKIPVPFTVLVQGSLSGASRGKIISRSVSGSKFCFLDSRFHNSEGGGVYLQSV